MFWKGPEFQKGNLDPEKLQLDIKTRRKSRCNKKEKKKKGKKEKKERKESIHL